MLSKKSCCLAQIYIYNKILLKGITLYELENKMYYYGAKIVHLGFYSYGYHTCNIAN